LWGSIEEEKEATVCLKLEDNLLYDTKLLMGYFELTVCTDGKLV